MKTRLYTTAPETYDAATTMTVRVVGLLSLRDNAVLREVDVTDTDDHEWQRARYLSGLYECWMPADFDLLAKITGLVSLTEDPNTAESSSQ